MHQHTCYVYLFSENNQQPSYSCKQAETQAHVLPVTIDMRIKAQRPIGQRSSKNDYHNQLIWCTLVQNQSMVSQILCKHCIQWSPNLFCSCVNFHQNMLFLRPLSKEIIILSKNCWANVRPRPSLKNMTTGSKSHKAPFSCWRKHILRHLSWETFCRCVLETHAKTAQKCLPRDDTWDIFV